MDFFGNAVSHYIHCWYWCLYSYTFVSRYDAYNCILGKGDYSPTKRKLTKRAERIGSFYWPLVTAVHLGWSFLSMDWHITWIVWPVAGVLFTAIIGLYNILKDDEE